MYGATVFLVSAFSHLARANFTLGDIHVTGIVRDILTPHLSLPARAFYRLSPDMSDSEENFNFADSGSDSEGYKPVAKKVWLSALLDSGALAERVVLRRAQSKQYQRLRPRHQQSPRLVLRQDRQSLRRRSHPRCSRTRTRTWSTAMKT